MVNVDNIDNNLRERALSKIKLKTREDFLNVFTPASPINTPAKFVGRQKQLEEMITALLSKGADLIVYGERGCGKSSLAYMLHAVAQGDFELLDYYNLRERLENRGFLPWLMGTDKKSFNVIWVNGFGKRLDEVIHSILTRRRERLGSRIYGAGLLSYLPSEADQIEVATKIGFNKVFVAENELKEVHVPEKPINIKEGFELATQRYADSHSDQLLIIIDEFETIQNRAEIAFYSKNIPNVRFVLVGIAETTFDLIGQHHSISRQFHAVKLEPMTEKELEGILNVGKYQLRNHCNILYEAIQQIVDSSYRSPYWCHFFAKTLLQDYLESQKSFEKFRQSKKKPMRIGKKEFEEMINGLQDNAECRLFEEQLKMVTLNDDINWSVLTTIGEQEETLMVTENIVNQVSQSSDISESDARATIDGFLEMQHGPFEVKSQIRDRRSFVFRDPNFKRYILFRGQQRGKSLR
jgi:Cdc6-like AAA superfamily ATPase